MLVGRAAARDPRDALVRRARRSASCRPARASGRPRCAGAPSCSPLRADLEVVELRGNVDTRLRKLAEGEVDAVVLAARRARAAGPRARRRGRCDSCPRAGQGTLALEARAGDEPGRRRPAIADARPALPHGRAGRRARIGRRLPHAGGRPRAADGDGLRIAAFVGLPDGSAWVRDELAGATTPEALARSR